MSYLRLPTILIVPNVSSLYQFIHVKITTFHSHKASIFSWFTIICFFNSEVCVPDITIILLLEHYCMSFVLKYSHVAMITQCRLLPSLIHLSLDVSMCHLFS